MSEAQRNECPLERQVIPRMRRVWEMPNANTFDVRAIGDMVRANLRGVSVDPFARNSQLCTYTNDLNPATKAEYHMQAPEFLKMLVAQGVRADTVIFDPPYSPRQIAECYAASGLTADMQATQSGRLYKDCRREILRLCKVGSKVLSFGWNTVGMGPMFECEEILLVCHGGAHNDTICMVERMTAKQAELAV